MSSKKQEKSKISKGKSQKGVASGKSINNSNPIIWLTGILIITFIVFSPSLKNGFTNWDDNVYVPENNLIKSISSENIKKMFDTQNHVSLNYHPITILSLAIDYKISQYNAKTFHLTNILFHLFNTALVFSFIFLLSDKKLMVAVITSILFGIHPMHVESVSWIAERKDVLYVFFFMLSLIVYLKYIQESGKKKIILYVLVFFLFLLSILSKAMAIVLPLVLLLIDFYMDRKFDKNVVLEKLPFFALSLIFGLLAVKIQSNGAIANFAVFTIPQRICFASYGIVNYIYSVFIPINLSCFYRYPTLVDNHMPYIYYLAPVIVIALLCATIYMAKKNKVIFFGVFFFVTTVAMVLQFISVGKAIVADRYTYLSYIGIFFIIAMSYDWLQNTNDEKFNIYKKTAPFLLGGFLMFIAYQTFQRTKVWKDSEILWTDAITKDPQNETAYTNRGSYLINKTSFDVDKKKAGEPEYEKALADFNISIGMSPRNAKVFTNRANIYGLKKQFDLSLQDYTKAIQLDSTDAEVYANRGVTYSIMGQFDKALVDYNKAMSMRANFTTAKQNRAYAYVSIGQYEKGIKELNELIAENPNSTDLYMYRGVAYYNLKNYTAALADNNAAIKLEPNLSRAYYNRSATFKIMGRFQEALNDALKAQSLGYPVDINYLKELKR